MARIKVNLLGKKKAEVPFGLGETFAKLGLKTDDFESLRPGLIRLIVLCGGLYAGHYVPNYIYSGQLAELDKKLEALNARQEQLKTELASKNGIRNQMTQLNDEEVQLQRQLKAVSSLKQDRGIAFESLDGLMTRLPTTIWLSNIKYSDRKVSFNGSSWDYFSINDFVKTINESIQYTNVQFRGIQTKPAEQAYPGIPDSIKKIKTFDLEYQVKSSGDST